MRKFEHFTKTEIETNQCVALSPLKLYKQERDWTCSIACIRTLLSNIVETSPSEDWFIKQYKMSHGPYYSHDIKELGMLSQYDVKFGCDERLDLDGILQLIQNGYYVMLESMINYAHWMVLLGFYPLADNKDLETSTLLFYDPYYNKIRLVNADEFLGMWLDGDHWTNNITNDYIAIKRA